LRSTARVAASQHLSKRKAQGVVPFSRAHTLTPVVFDSPRVGL